MFLEPNRIYRHKWQKLNQNIKTVYIVPKRNHTRDLYGSVPHRDTIRLCRSRPHDGTALRGGPPPILGDAEAISSDKFRSSEDTNPTYGRNGKVKVTAAAAEAQKFEKATQSKGKEEKQMQLLPRPGIKAVPLTSWAIHGGDSASAVPTMFVMHLAAVTSARER